MKKLKIAITILFLISVFVITLQDGEAGISLLLIVVFLIYGMFRTKPKQDVNTVKGFARVEVTPPTCDYGADIVAYDNKGRKWVIQCKRYTGKVNNKAVQEAVTAKAHYKAECAAVMTNSRLTEKARQLAFDNAVELFEGLSD